MISIESAVEPCGCGSILCYGCRCAKALLVMANDLERIYPNNEEMQRRARRLRVLGIAWLTNAAEDTVEQLRAELHL